MALNLDAFVAGNIEAVNPRIALTVQLSSGYSYNAQRQQVPSYETPCSFEGSLSGTELTASVVSSGYLRALQTISGASVAAGTVIASQTSGPPGGAGVYQVNIAQDVSSEAMTSALILPGQVQPLQYKDLMQIDGMNLNGTRKKIYLYGVVEATVRVLEKGGSLIQDPYGNTWLVAVVVEQWYHDRWCAVLCTLQNGS